jgi:hypothetical protein
MALNLGLLPVPKQQFFLETSGAGQAPNAGGYILFYQAGTSNATSVYFDALGTVPAGSNVSLDGNGFAPQLYLNGYVKMAVYSANGVLQWSADNVSSSPGANASNVSSLNNQWITLAGPYTWISGTQFSVATNLTATLQLGMRIQEVDGSGTHTGTITAASYGAPNTTVTVVWDSGSMASSITSIAYGMLTPVAPAIPILPTNIQTGNYSMAGSDINRTVEFSVAPSNLACTVSNATVGLVTANNHGLSIGDQIVFSVSTANGVMPANTSLNTFYYPLTANFTANAFNYSASNGGAAINTTGNASSNVAISKCATFTPIAANAVPAGATVSLMNISAGLVTISGNVAGLSNPALINNIGTILSSDGTVWDAFSLPVFTPTANTIPVRNANKDLLDRNSNPLFGLSTEVSNSVNVITSAANANMGNVKVGDRISITGILSANFANGTGVSIAANQSSGTANMVFGSNLTQIGSGFSFNNLGSTQPFLLTCSGIAQVTSNGSLVLSVGSFLGANSNSTTVTPCLVQIYAVFLKQQ